MATNKINERFATFGLKVPTGINIASGAAVCFGEGTGAMAGVAVEAQSTTNPTFDSNSGFLTIDFEGVYSLSVTASHLASPSAGAAIRPGDKVYYAGGTYDPTTGFTTGGTLCVDTTGIFFGIAVLAVAAGVTATIPVILKNAPCS